MSEQAKARKEIACPKCGIVGILEGPVGPEQRPTTPVFVYCPNGHGVPIAMPEVANGERVSVIWPARKI